MLLLQNYPAAIQCADNAGRVPLHYAAMRASVGAVSRIFNIMMNSESLRPLAPELVCAIDVNGVCPVMAAVGRDDASSAPSVVDVLCERSCKVAGSERLRNAICMAHLKRFSEACRDHGVRARLRLFHSVLQGMTEAARDAITVRHLDLTFTLNACPPPPHTRVRNPDA